jgi:hypothetical protein
VNGAWNGLAFFVLGHPVGLEEIVANQMPQKGECKGFHDRYFTGFCDFLTAGLLTLLLGRPDIKNPDAPVIMHPDFLYRVTKQFQIF